MFCKVAQFFKEEKYYGIEYVLRCNEYGTR